MRNIRHHELRGGYAMGRKVIIDTCKLAENEYETMAFHEGNFKSEDLEELSCKNATTEAAAIKDFNDMVFNYAEPLQKVMLKAGLTKGKRYTLAYCNEFGFPVAQKITFDSLELTTYAQHSDVVKMTFTPYKKRTLYQKFFYNMSIMIFEGWQVLKEEDTKKVLRNNGVVKTTISKYAGFDSRYIEDMEKKFVNPIVIYKNFRAGVNGKLYA